MPETAIALSLTADDVVMYWESGRGVHPDLYFLPRGSFRQILDNIEPGFYWSLVAEIRIIREHARTIDAMVLEFWNQHKELPSAIKNWNPDHLEELHGSLDFPPELNLAIRELMLCY